MVSTPNNIISEARKKTPDWVVIQPSRTGLIRVLLAVESQEVSSRLAPFIAESLLKVAELEGSEAALCQSGSFEASANDEAIFLPRLPKRRERYKAAPKVPPSCLKRVLEAVATPISLGEAELCTAIVKG